MTKNGQLDKHGEFQTKYGWGDYDGLIDMDYDLGEWGLNDFCDNEENQCIHIGMRNFCDYEHDEPDYEIQIWIDDDPTYYSTNHLGNLKSMYKKAIKKVEDELDRTGGKELDRDAVRGIGKWLEDAGREWKEKQNKKAFSKRVNNWLKGMGINKEVA